MGSGRTTFFAGRAIKKPGFYSQIVSGVKNNSFVSLSYSGLLVIDTGSGAGWGMGAGIAGTLAKNADAIHTFTSLPDFQSEVKGGMWWKLAEKLFYPNGTRDRGITSIDYVRACDTTPAEISLDFTGGSSIVLQCKDEGVVGNGLRNDVLATDTLTVTVAGAEADVITLKVDGSTIGTYTVGATPTIAGVVSGLYDNCVIQSTTTGFSFSNKTSTGFTYTAPANTGANANSYIPSIVKTGTVAATVGATMLGGVAGNALVKGYAVKLTAGSLNTSKYQLTFLRGKWRGDDTLNLSTGKSNSKSFLLSGEEVLGYSAEFSTLSELKSWMDSNANFKDWFYVSTFDIVGSGAVVGGDVTNMSSYQFAVGGVEDYGDDTTYLNTVLEYVKGNYASFILLDNYGATAVSSTNNLLIGAWNTLEARFPKQIYIAAGTTEEDFMDENTDSLKTAMSYDNQTITVVHGGVGYTANGGGYELYNSMMHAAQLLGREAGLAPQIPLTQKQIGVQKLIHTLSDKQQDLSIDAGVLTSILDTDYDPPRYVCLNGVNTLQNNSANPPINIDGTTYSKQLFRIVSQINKEIAINGKRRFFGDARGVNRFTASKGAVEAFVKDYLSTKTVSSNTDNLIISFRNIIATIVGDTVNISYEFEPNFEVKFFFATGTVIDPTVG